MTMGSGAMMENLPLTLPRNITRNITKVVLILKKNIRCSPTKSYIKTGGADGESLGPPHGGPVGPLRVPLAEPVNQTCDG